jgi:hypothetical protein
MPELDVKGMKSPSVENWFNEIEQNDIIKRESIHIIFLSAFFGVIPLELIDTYPMGQNESIAALNENDPIYEKSLIRARNFLEKYSKLYEKCGILIPKTFSNQFGETEKFPQSNPIHGLNNEFLSKLKLKHLRADNIKKLIYFFKEA